MSEIWYSSLFHDRGLVGLQPIKNPSTIDKKSLLYLVTIDKHKRIAFSMSEIWYSSLFHDRGLVGLQPIKNPSTIDKKSLLYLVTIDKHKRIA